MAGFEAAWSKVSRQRDGEPVSSELKPLLNEVYLDFQSTPVSLPSLKKHLSALLEYLSGAGRTNANCWAVDLFFCVSDEIGWEKDWTDEELPEDFHEVLARMGQALHDAVTNPELAANFGCLPEQLLERTRRLAP